MSLNERRLRIASLDTAGGSIRIVDANFFSTHRTLTPRRRATSSKRRRRRRNKRTPRRVEQIRHSRTDEVFVVRLRRTTNQPSRRISKVSRDNPSGSRITAQTPPCPREREVASVLSRRLFVSVLPARCAQCVRDDDAVSSNTRDTSFDPARNLRRADGAVYSSCTLFLSSLRDVVRRRASPPSRARVRSTISNPPRRRRRRRLSYHLGRLLSSSSSSSSSTGSMTMARRNRIRRSSHATSTRGKQGEHRRDAVSR